MSPVKVIVARLPHGKGLPLPAYQTPGSAGLDLMAAIAPGAKLFIEPGARDSDYRGEVSVILINLGAEPFEITRGARIAQLIVAPVTQAVLVEADDLNGTARGAGGFGSTGVDGAGA